MLDFGRLRCRDGAEKALHVIQRPIGVVGGERFLVSVAVADGAQSLIREQVEMGVAVRMAVLEALSRNLPNI